MFSSQRIPGGGRVHPPGQGEGDLRGGRRSRQRRGHGAAQNLPRRRSRGFHQIRSSVMGSDVFGSVVQWNDSDYYRWVFLRFVCRDFGCY